MLSSLICDNGPYLAARIRQSVLPSLRTFSKVVTRDVLSGFEGLERRADAVSEAEYARLGSCSGSSDDENFGQAAEAAYEAGIDFYLMMSEFRQGTVNLLAVGLFHLFEQQLQHISKDGLFRGLPPLDDSKLAKAEEWFRTHLGIELESFQGWDLIEGELRLVVNTIKHGDGPSASRLRKINPKLFEDPSVSNFDHFEWLKRPEFSHIEMPLTGNSIYVSEEQLQTYALATQQVFEELAQYLASISRANYR